MRNTTARCGFVRVCFRTGIVVAGAIIAASWSAPTLAQALPTLTADFGLPEGFSPGPLRVTATSSAVNNGGVYTITETVRFSDSSNFTGISGAFGNFFWFSVNRDGPAEQAPFPKIWSDVFLYQSPQTPNHIPASATWQSIAPVVAAPGLIFVDAGWTRTPTDFGTPPGTISANAATWAIAPQTPMGVGSGSLSASFDSGNGGLQLDSDVMAIGGGSYRYDYTLTNTTSEAVTVDWASAAINATLAPGESLSQAIISDRMGRQANGYATLDGETFADVEFIANAIVPAPEPTTTGLLLGGVTLLGLWRRLRVRRSDVMHIRNR